MPITRIWRLAPGAGTSTVNRVAPRNGLGWAKPSLHRSKSGVPPIPVVATGDAAGLSFPAWSTADTL